MNLGSTASAIIWGETVNYWKISILLFTYLEQSPALYKIIERFPGQARERQS